MHDVCLIIPWLIKQAGCSAHWLAGFNNSDIGINAMSSGKSLSFTVV